MHTYFAYVLRLNYVVCCFRTKINLQICAPWKNSIRSGSSFTILSCYIRHKYSSHRMFYFLVIEKISVGHSRYSFPFINWQNFSFVCILFHHFFGVLYMSIGRQGSKPTSLVQLQLMSPNNVS
jgi:hypothetical protein